MNKKGIGYYHKISGYDVFTQSWKGFSTVERTNILHPMVFPEPDLVVLRWYKDPEKPKRNEITREVNIAEVDYIETEAYFSRITLSPQYSQLISEKKDTLTAVLETHLPDYPDYDEDMRYLRITGELNPDVVYFGGERPPSIGDD